MSIYKKSEKAQPVIIRRPIITTTIIQAYGDGDDYTAPFDLFGDDENIRIIGTVIAVDGADLSIGVLRLTINGGSPINVPMTYAAGVNSFQHDLGALAEGDYTVTATFLRLRKTPSPGEDVEIVYLDEYEPSSATICFGSSGDPIYIQSTKQERFRIRAVVTEVPGCPFTNLIQFPNLYNLLCRLWQRYNEAKKRFQGQI